MARSRKARSAARPTPACKKCRPRRNGEAFYFMRERYVFDVDLAREIVADGREPFEIDEHGVRVCVDTCDVDWEHATHVNPTIPGIVAHVWYPDPSGEIVHGHRIIDGHHRAARSLLDGVPYLAHVLTEAESRLILMRSPADEPAAKDAADDCPAECDAAVALAEC